MKKIPKFIVVIEMYTILKFEVHYGIHSISSFICRTETFVFCLDERYRYPFANSRLQHCKIGIILYFIARQVCSLTKSELVKK